MLFVQITIAFVFDAIVFEDSRREYKNGDGDKERRRDKGLIVSSIEHSSFVKYKTNNRQTEPIFKHKWK